MRHKIKVILATIHNLILFVPLAIWHGIPPHQWREAWQGAEAEHRAAVHKVVWQSKCEGEIYEDGEGRLWRKF